jgi:S1-C subfamily serine protease
MERRDAVVSLQRFQLHPFPRSCPAAQADVREGDVIIRFGTQSVAAVDDLHRLLTLDRIGSSVPVTIIRRSEELVVEIVPVEKSS